MYDFGCNLSGDVEITLEGKQGETVEIVYGERLDARGGIDQTLIKRHGDIPRNQIDYYRKGKDGEETWHPEFSYKGFRMYR
ncbi:MAG: family 78 glycoside hydrolase catalytic domain [Eisenbergiella sp.]